jgi:hypothetical protein
MAGGMVTWFVVLLLTRNFIAASAAAAVGAVIGGPIIQAVYEKITRRDN